MGAACVVVPASGTSAAQHVVKPDDNDGDGGEGAEKVEEAALAHVGLQRVGLDAVFFEDGVGGGSDGGVFTAVGRRGPGGGLMRGDGGSLGREIAGLGQSGAERGAGATAGVVVASAAAAAAISRSSQASCS